MGKYLSIAGMMLVAVLLSVQPSKADSFVTYELAGHGLDITFTLPQTLTPSSVTSNGILNFQNVTGSFGHGGTYNFSTLQIGASGYGFTNYWAFGSQTHFFALLAPGLFTWNSDGTVTLNTGTYSFGDYHVFNGGPFDYTLTIVDPPGALDTIPTPEPASIILLGMGALTLGAIRRRKAS